MSFSEAQQFTLDHLAKLNGGKIIGQVIDTESDSFHDFYGLRIEMPDGSQKIASTTTD